MTLRPLGDLVFVRPLPAAPQRGRIIVPVAARDNSRLGRVVAAGPRAAVAVGAKVLLSHASGREIDLGGRMLVMREDEILAVLDCAAESLAPEDPFWRGARPDWHP